MSYYYKYHFISPEGTYANVKEELKSYFDTGAVDDLMFPVYADKCLRKLGKSSYNIREEVLFVDDFKARLPDNFYAVREAWLCTEIDGFPYRTANSFYSQAHSLDTIQVSPVTVNDRACNNPSCSDPNCDGYTCLPVVIQAVYKTNNESTHTYKKIYLLKPGNISVKAHCTLDCENFNSSASDTFDIRDNKFVTNFRHGKVYLVFYATDYDNAGNQLIPDNYRIREYIEAFIKYKVFETLANQINDETFDQLQKKLAYYKGLSDEAYILAEMEIKKQDVYAKKRAIKKNLNRFNAFELPERITRYGWRRNT